VPEEVNSSEPPLKFGFATIFVRVATAPSASVDVLIIVMSGGVVSSFAPLASVEVKTTGVEKVVSGCLVIVLSIPEEGDT
jgi:hypothetical protein